MFIKFIISVLERLEQNLRDSNHELQKMYKTLLLSEEKKKAVKLYRHL